MLPGPLRDLVNASEFHVGLSIGAVLSGSTILFLTDRRQHSVVALGGLLVALGFVIGTALTGSLAVSLAFGVLLLGLAGFVADRIPTRAVVAPLLALPGAIVVASDLGSRPRWIAIVTALAIALANPLVSDFDRRHARAGWSLPLYAISVIGVYFTVPDTERALVLLGVILPLGFLGWRVPLVSLGAAGSYAAVGILIWVGAFESRGRESAFIGAIACLALLVIEPLAHSLGSKRHTIIDTWKNEKWAIVPMAGAQLVLVYIASRVAGRQNTVAEAVIVVGFELVTAVSVLRAASIRTDS